MYTLNHVYISITNSDTNGPIKNMYNNSDFKHAVDNGFLHNLWII